MAASKSTRVSARNSRPAVQPKSRDDSLVLLIAGACAVAEVLESSFVFGDARFVVIRRHIIAPLNTAIQMLGGSARAQARLKAIEAAMERG